MDSKETARRIGAKIRQLRKAKGWSLEKMALESDMNATFLGHVERGLRCPTVYTLQRICDGLGITLAELFLESADTADACMRHVTEVMSTLTPAQARRVAALVDDAVSLLHEDSI